MSLMSLLSASTASQLQAYGSGTAAAALQKALAAQASANGTTGTSTSTSASTGSDVSISAAAQEAADNAKDFTALGKEVRATLDAQYKAAGATDGTAPAPNLSKMSGRALAAIALNRDKTFSATEVRAAKTALRNELRADLSSAIGASGVTLSGLSSYSQSLVTQYDSMSSEEREARGWTAQFRATNASFVMQASQPTLFDQLDD